MSPPPAKRSHSESTTKLETVKNHEGEEMLDLSGKKYVSVREFKGKTLIDIREFYEKEGNLLPGKKGISLSVEQYNNLKKAIESIDSQLNQPDDEE